MADIISLAASITALAGLAETVFIKGSKYVKAVKICGEEVRRLIIEINDFCGIISRLGQVLENEEVENKGATIGCGRSDHIHSVLAELRTPDIANTVPAYVYECQRTLNEILHILQAFEYKANGLTGLTHEGSSISWPWKPNLTGCAFKTDLKWPLSKRATMKMLQRLERHKTTCILALSADEINTLRQKDNSESTDEALRLAIRLGNTVVVNKLLMQGADPDRCHYNGKTPLLLALDLGHDEIAMTLVKHGAEIHARSTSQETPVTMVLCGIGGLEYAENIFCPLQELIITPEEADSILKHAIATTSKRLLEWIIRRLDESSRLAAIEDLEKVLSIYRPDLVELLIDERLVRYKVLEELLLKSCISDTISWSRHNEWVKDDDILSVSSGTHSHHTTDMSNSIAKHPTMLTLQLLLKHGISSNTTSNVDMYSCLHHAIINGLYPHAKLLLSSGAKPNLPGPSHWAPVHLAVYHAVFEEQGIQLIKLLANFGADLNAKLADGMTALHLAAKRDKPQIAEYLLARGADPRDADLYGGVPLHIACTSGSESIVQILLASDSLSLTLDLASDFSGTPLYAAARHGHLNIVKMLVEAGANVNLSGVLDNLLGPPLFAACAENYTDTVKLLLQHGAELVSENGKYKSAVVLAIAFRQTAVLEMIQKVPGATNSLPSRGLVTNGNAKRPLDNGNDNSHDMNTCTELHERKRLHLEHRAELPIEPEHMEV